MPNKKIKGSQIVKRLKIDKNKSLIFNGNEKGKGMFGITETKITKKTIKKK